MPIIRGEETSTPSAGKMKGKAKNRLDEVKLKICEKREATIQKRSISLVTRAEKIESRFDRIVDKVDEFYVDKVVPKAGEIDEYEGLLDRVEDRRRDVAAALGVAESTAENFECDNQKPKMQVKQFKDDMHVVIGALKEYKKAIVDFLVAVRTKGKNIKTPVATDSGQPVTPSASQQ
ncbi:hypothetical protein IH981_04435 [Patescibacteria group bacterium]|nr:hypothetical protein [Patescibacteria group bacterium]